MYFYPYIHVQCVTMTGCGNFAILGMSSGHIELFNVQSGIHRGEIGRPKGRCRHDENLILLTVWIIGDTV